MPKKSNNKIIGLTGGIATGKSTVTGILRQIRIPVICADEIAHAVTAKGQIAFRKIVKEFGKNILQKDGELDRLKIAGIIFKNQSARKTLEGIVHPAVQNEMFREIRLLQRKKYPLIFLDIPLLFESGMDQLCHYTVCVTSTRANQLARLAKRRGMSRKDALARIAAQMSLKEKTKRANFVLKNDDTKADLKRLVVKLIASLR